MVQFVVGDLLHLLARRAERTDSGQALLGVAAVQFQMLLHQRFQQSVRIGTQRVLGQQNLSERGGLLQHPGVHGRNEGTAADEVHL